MLMSRPALGLRAVNRELMRLVVCLCTAVICLKDGPLFRATGELPGLIVGPLSGPDAVTVAQGLCRHFDSLFSIYDPRLSSASVCHVCEEFRDS